MVGGETILEALKAGDTSSKTLSAFPNKIEQSYIKKELWQVRNFHPSFQPGMLRGFFHTAFQQITGGRGVIAPMPAHPGHQAFRKKTRRPAPRKFTGSRQPTFSPLTTVVSPPT